MNRQQPTGAASIRPHSVADDIALSDAATGTATNDPPIGCLANEPCNAARNT